MLGVELREAWPTSCGYNEQLHEGHSYERHLREVGGAVGRGWAAGGGVVGGGDGADNGAAICGGTGGGIATGGGITTDVDITTAGRDGRGAEFRGAESGRAETRGAGRG